MLSRKDLNPGVYLIKNTINQRGYIGASIKTESRIHQHWVSLKQNRHNNKELQVDWNKYGSGAFTSEILEAVDVELVRSNTYQLTVIEGTWIKHYFYTLGANLYNRKIDNSHTVHKVYCHEDYIEFLNTLPEHGGYKQLIRWRETHGLGQAELARKLRVTPATVWRWEQDKIPMPDWLRFALPQIEAELRKE